jgi:hypothetical protein
MAGHESPRTTKLYDRTKDEITLSEVERIRRDAIVFGDPTSSRLVPAIATCPFPMLKEATPSLLRVRRERLLRPWRYVLIDAGAVLCLIGTQTLRAILCVLDPERANGAQRRQR